MGSAIEGRMRELRHGLNSDIENASAPDPDQHPAYADRDVDTPPVRTEPAPA
jgi:hypothetical protein